MTTSHQFSQLLLVQILHHFPNVLGLVSRGNQQSVFRLHYYQIVYPKGRHKFSWRVNVVSLSIEGEPSLSGNQVVILRTALAGVIPAHRGPPPKIIPPEIGGKENDF